MRVCQRQRRHLCESLRGWLLVPPFTRAFVKSPSSRGLSAIAELLVWHSGALALSMECQSARVSKINNSRLYQYGAKPSNLSNLKQLALKRLTVIFSAAGHHRCSDGSTSSWLMTEEHVYVWTTCPKLLHWVKQSAVEPVNPTFQTLHRHATPRHTNHCLTTSAELTHFPTVFGDEKVEERS